MDSPNTQKTNQRINPLYFIALIPETRIMENVRVLKEEMRLKFNASHALKSPAHITFADAV